MSVDASSLRKSSIGELESVFESSQHNIMRARPQVRSAAVHQHFHFKVAETDLGFGIPQWRSGARRVKDLRLLR
jgi:hypothetical protein